MQAGRPGVGFGGGQLGKQNTSEAKRNAEALFENKPVADIREVCRLGNNQENSIWGDEVMDSLCLQIEARTRKDIEVKKLQLRQLVGDSYRWDKQQTDI